MCAALWGAGNGRPSGHSREKMMPDDRKPSVRDLPATPPESLKISKSEQVAMKQSQAQANCPGPFPVPIAVSVSGTQHRSGGQTIALDYDTVITNEGGAWVAPNQFVAPCAGLYLFTVSFVRDNYYFFPDTLPDDVFVSLYVNKGAPTSKLLGSAWAGENSPFVINGSRRFERMTGTYTVAIRLAEKDVVMSYVSSEKKTPTVELNRVLLAFHFTGVRIGN